MQSFWNKKRSFEAETFDMTPVIDVVFLLIIFFMLVCQFIAAEQFKVAVPDRIASAQADEVKACEPLTITVMAENGGAVCAVGSERLADVQGDDMAQLITGAVDELLTDEMSDKTVRLRCDKAVTFGQVKHILKGISNSEAATLDWA
ncbi:MAG: ExbD/TolR family protein, partial [Planctomycetota bacterium]